MHPPASQPPERPRILIVGGGVTGLSAAHRLLQKFPGSSVRLVERARLLGGNVRTLERDGFVIDGGPDSFIVTKPQAFNLAEELGLRGEMIVTRPRARKVFVVRGGRLVVMPPGMSLGVPTRIWPLLSSPILSLAGRLRALCEPLIPPKPGHDDETVHEFFARRAGEETAQALAGPLLGGIFGGDASELSLAATFPMLRHLERRYGSLAFGTYAMHHTAARGPAAAAPAPWENLPQPMRALHMLPWALRLRDVQLSPFVSFRRGMIQFVDALVARSSDAQISTETELVRLNKDRDSWVAQLATPRGREVWRTDAVLLACGAPVAARVLGDPTLVEQLGSLRFHSTATVFFGFERSAVNHPLDAAGFVVPKGEGDILAATFVSTKWADRAPPGHVLLRAFVGGARDPECVQNSSDEQLAEIALRELTRLIGRLGQPILTQVCRYERSNPQPVIGHRERVAALTSRADALGGLFIAGGGIDGVGIPDCVRQGETAAARIAQYCC